MADELDVEAMLEAPYRKEEDAGRSEKSSTTSARKDKKRKRSRSKERKRSRSRDRKSRSRSRDRRRRDEREKGRRRSKSRERRRSRSRDRDSRRKRSRSPGAGGRRRGYSRSPIRERLPELSVEERDVRTIFCMQLSARIRPRDLEEFFSSVGKVRDVRLITDNKTRRSKGIAYVEFADPESVTLAMGLTGQKLLGVPIIVQQSQAEKNRAQPTTQAATQKQATEGPLRLYVGSLHFNINEDMLRGIFEPFGKIVDIKIMKDHDSQRSLGFGFISFANADDAKKALDQLNGFELAGRPMKVGHVTERTGEPGVGPPNGVGGQLDTDEMDRAGIDLGATGRLQLMAKLAEGTGFQIPQYAASALNNISTTPPAVPAMAPAPPPPANFGIPPPVPTTVAAPPPVPVTTAPPIATQCFMLSNMFDSTNEARLTWDQEVRDDVIDECNKHGGVLHIYVDKNSPQGNVYVKCPSISAAVASVNSLHGRYFAGRVITAAYVPLPNYHNLFVESMRANQLLMPSSQALSGGYQTGFMAQPPMR